MNYTNSFQYENYIWILSIILFIAHNIWDLWLFKKYGADASPVRGVLIKKGYDGTFGIVRAFIYLLSVVVIVVIKGLFEIDGIYSKKILMIGSIIQYIVLVVFLNVWAKRYLIIRGIEPKAKDGYKGVIQTYKDAVEKEKEKQRKKQQEKDEESLF